MPTAALVDPAQHVLVEGFAADFGAVTMGRAGQWLLPLCIVISTFGAANGSAFTGGRLVHVSAREGHLPACLGVLWGRDRPTPMRAVVFQSAAWS